MELPQKWMVELLSYILSKSYKEYTHTHIYIYIMLSFTVKKDNQKNDKITKFIELR